MNNILNRISLSRFALILLMIYGVFYVGNALSPSSYGVFLNQIGAKSEGLFYGKPREIRSDEWAVYTPLLQATVNNNFARYNQTSPYHEDLRPSFSLPLKDWSIPFKPALLGFHFLPPAYAFSLYYFIVMALFLSGFFMMFRAMQMDEVYALIFTALVYFSGFVQNWWSIVGPMTAFFAWSYVVLVSRKDFYLRLVLFYFLISSMMFSMFYPVFFYGFAVITVVLLYCFNRNFFTIRNVAAFGSASILALLTYLFYIQDSLLLMANTIYPGQRQLISGGDVTLMQWLSQFFPSLIVSEAQGWDLSGTFNVCEMGVVGSYLFLFCVLFGKWRDCFKNLSSEQLKSLKILLAVLTFFSCWMLLPIPPIIVKIILLDRVNGIRCFFIIGMCLLAIAMIILPKLEFVIDARRSTAAVFILCFVAMLPIFIYNVQDFEVMMEELTIVLLLLSLLAVHYFIIDLGKNFKIAVLVIVVLNNVLVFGKFNPLQSAKPIFNIPQTEFVKKLYERNQYNKDGFFVGEYMVGAIGNGIGLKSITHVLYVPQLQFFRCYFPEMSESEFNQIFNRYLRVILEDSSVAKNVQPDSSVLPRSRFKTSSAQQHQCLEDLNILSK